MSKYEAVFGSALVIASFFLFKFLNCVNPLIIAIATPLIALVHEVLHVVALRILGLRYKFTFTGTKIGFLVQFSKRRDYIVCALFPQVLTIVLLASSFLLARELLVVALIHVAMSAHDIFKSFGYLIYDRRA